MMRMRNAFVFLFFIGLVLILGTLVAGNYPQTRKLFDEDKAAGAGNADLAKQVMAKVNDAHYTLTMQYIVYMNAEYAVEENGKNAGTMSATWDPYRGLVAKLNGQLQTVPLNKNDIEFIVGYAWNESLFADYKSEKRQAAQTADGFLVTEQRDNGSILKLTVARDNQVPKRVLEFTDGTMKVENEVKCQAVDGKYYVDTMGLDLTMPNGKNHVIFTLGYKMVDGLPVIKRLDMDVDSTDARTNQRLQGKFALNLTKANFMKITPTDKGLFQDRVDAFVAITVSMDLKKPDKKDRLNACNVIAKLGVPHGLLVLPLLEQVAQNDQDGEVRQAAAATVNTLKNAQGGGAARPRTLVDTTGGQDTGGGGGGGQTNQGTVGGIVRKPVTDPRIYGTWQGTFVMYGAQYTQTITFRQDGTCKDALVNQWGKLFMNRAGKFSLEDNTLTILYPREAPSACTVEFQNENNFIADVSGITISYQRISR